MTGSTTAPSASRTCPTSMSRMEARNNDEKWWTNHFDDYNLYMEAGSAGRAWASSWAGADRILAKDLEQSSYDSFLATAAMDRILAAHT